MTVSEFTQPGLFPAGEWCQRWEDRTQSWRHTSEGGFVPDAYEVVELAHADALPFVTRHHYSGAFSSAVLRYGMVERHSRRLVGVCVFGNGMTPAVLLNPFPQLEPHRQSLELSRLVLLDEVPANAESWFVARTFKMGAAVGLRGVVMYSDPNERMTPAGLIMPGHLGIVYQALGLTYVGVSKPRFEIHLPDGTVLPERSLSKVRGLEQGAGGSVRRLVELGAGDPGELAALTVLARGEWLEAALVQAGARRVKRAGKHRYLAVIGDRSQRRATKAGIELPALPYPKRPAVALALAA